MHLVKTFLINERAAARAQESLLCFNAFLIHLTNRIETIILDTTPPYRMKRDISDFGCAKSAVSKENERRNWICNQSKRRLRSSATQQKGCLYGMQGPHFRCRWLYDHCSNRYTRRIVRRQSQDRYSSPGPSKKRIHSLYFASYPFHTWIFAWSEDGGVILIVKSRCWRVHWRDDFFGGHIFFDLSSWALTAEKTP